MKLTTEQQAAFNEIARNVYLAEQANRAKTEAIESPKPVIVKYEAELREGIACRFELGGGRRVNCRFVLRMTQKWQDADVEVMVG